MFNWKRDDTNFLHILRNEIARTEVQALLTEIRVRHEICRVVPWLESALATAQVELSQREATLDPAFREVERLKGELQKVGAELASAQAAHEAMGNGLNPDDLTDEARKKATSYPILSQQYSGIQQDLRTATERALYLSEGIDVERQQLKNGRNHLLDLQTYLGQPLPDSAWLIDWLRSQISVATENSATENSN